MEYAIRYPDRVLTTVLRDTSADNAHRELSRRNALASPRIEVDHELFGCITAGTTRDNADLKAAWAMIFEQSGHAPQVEEAPKVQQTVRDSLRRALAAA